MPKQVFSGEDSLSNIGAILKAEDVKKLAIFTDKGIQNAGLLDFPLNEHRITRLIGINYTT